jgi:hypothetical protein
MKSILTRIAIPTLALAFTAPVFAQQGAPGGSLKYPQINASSEGYPKPVKRAPQRTAQAGYQAGSNGNGTMGSSSSGSTGNAPSGAGGNATMNSNGSAGATDMGTGTTR